MKHPGTSGSMPIKGTGCGIRPDLDEMSADTSFDFSMAKAVFEEQEVTEEEQGKEGVKKVEDNNQSPTSN